MNSTDSEVKDESTLTKDFVFWIGIIGLVGGCIVEIILTIFFCVNVFFTSKENDLNSAYFKITVIGYIVDIISSGNAVISQFADPANVSLYVGITNFAILYADLHIGLMLVLMGLNRCTALAYPFVHRKIWEGYPFYVIVLLFVVAPFGIGYKYLFGPCLIDLWKSQCALDIIGYYFLATVINIPLCVLTLIVILIGICSYRKQSTSHSNLQNVEKRLVWQTISSSVLLIFYYASNYVGGIIYEQSPDIGSQLYSISIIVYAIHTYSAIVILFIVSTNFRQQFIAFYGCRKNKIQNGMGTTTVLPVLSRR